MSYKFIILQLAKDTTAGWSGEEQRHQGTQLIIEDWSKMSVCI